MRDGPTSFIGGRWVDPVDPRPFEVVNPATEEPIATVALGGPADVDLAVAAARDSLAAWSTRAPEDRADVLDAIAAAYRERLVELCETITAEMGAPATLATAAHGPLGLAHLATAAEVARTFEFTKRRGTTLLRYEGVGVCGLVTPWNWPTNQIMCKVAPALAAGCTVVLKPSEFTPFTAVILAEAIEAAGVPPGVVNVVMGDGPSVGGALAAHPGVDMLSLTGSTAAGVAVSKAAADSVKRVCLELGGKSPNILLPDADLEAAVARGVVACMRNSGQSCNAPTRMLVPRDRHDEVCAIARQAAEGLQVGDPTADGTDLGPVANRRQFERVQHLISVAIEEGGDLVCGGLGRPDGIERGWFVRPTVFADLTNDRTIAREEVFGPVLAILPYDTVDEAVEIANDSDYGLSGYVQSGDLDRAVSVAPRLHTGMVHLNGARPDFDAPFGGYKRSGNGREWGREGVEEYLEVTAIMGAG